ncbi:hypothetical protein [Photobacterium profundum]|uniref:Rap1a immunity protein domain-containing protein n=1 Tax=Photobacterium profundum (strain SS9) TaxID=298386 RepID=Q6LW79_PHOPR|nr:hypothetical protein [Photobacterium profundum]CAG17956.1 hypothetical protein PBPRC0018 [Photobacterium profundum SS9]
MSCVKRLFFITFLSLATPLHAASIQTHLDSINGPDPTVRAVAETYLNGIVDASMYINALLGANNKPRAFCLPSKQPLNRQRLADIIADTYHNAPTDKQDPTLNTGMIAIIGLTNTYPCKGDLQ